MAIPNRTYFRVLNDVADATGASEFSVAAETSAIGGGATDEHAVLLENATHAYTTHNRAVLTEDFRHGDGASQATLCDTSSTSYTTAVRAAAETQADRGAVTVVVSYQGRAQVSLLNRAGGVLAGPTQGADSPSAITTAAISLDAGSTEKIIVLVELKKTGASDAALYGYRVLEDQTPTSGVTHSDFVALDSDCLDSGAGRAGAAPWYQQIERNILAGENDRRRRGGKAFAVDARPVLFGASAMATPLFVWFVPDKARPTVTLDLHGLCTGDGAGGHAFSARLAIQDKGGVVLDTATPTPVNDDGSEQFVTVTTPRAGAYRGEAVMLWLIVTSEDVGSAVGTTDLNMSTNLQTGGRRLRFDSTLAAAYDAAKRWRLTFAQDPAGTYGEQDTGYPPSVAVIKDDASDIKRIFPGIDPAIGEAGNYPLLSVALQELGRFKLYSYCWREDYADNTAALAPWRPYKPPFAVGYRSHYLRQYRLYSRFERVCHTGGTGNTFDRLPSTKGKWGSWRQYNGGADVEIGAALLGAVPSYKISTTAAATKYRRRYRVAVAICALTSSAAGFESITGAFKATLASFSAGAWGGDTVTRDIDGATRQFVPMRAVAAFGIRPLSSEILWPLQDHKLSGAWLWDDVRRGQDNLVIVEGTFDDTETGAAVSSRLLRLKMDMSGDFRGAGGSLVGLAVYCPTFTVSIDEGF